MKLLVLRGDGIGPEIVSAALTAIEALNRKFELGLEYEDADFGLASIEKNGEALPQATLDRARASDGIICGPHDSVAYPLPHDQAITPAGRLRKELDLFANIRPGPQPVRRARARRRNGPRGVPGEHRGFLRRSLHVCRRRRIHADTGHRH